MSQYTIMELLKKDKDRWFDVNDIMEELNLSRQSITSSIRRLRMTRFIECKFLRRKKLPPKYLIKHR